MKHKKRLQSVIKICQSVLKIQSVRVSQESKKINWNLKKKFQIWSNLQTNQHGSTSVILKYACKFSSRSIYLILSFFVPKKLHIRRTYAHNTQNLWQTIFPNGKHTSNEKSIFESRLLTPYRGFLVEKSKRLPLKSHIINT